MALTTIPSGMIAPAQTFSLNGVTFPATQVPSSDANTLDDYEEGTWTPTDNSGAGLTFTTVAGTYTKIGRMVYCFCNITYPITANGAQASIGGLPFTSTATLGALGGGFVRYTDRGTSPVTTFAVNPNAAIAYFYALGGGATTNTNLSGTRTDLVISYQAAN